MKSRFLSLCLLILAINANSQNWLTGLNGSTTNAKFGFSANQALNFYTSNHLWMTLNTIGRFGIGTSDPQALFHVAGKAIVNDDFFAGSSIVVKDNFHIDHIPATATTPNIISFKTGIGGNVVFEPYTGPNVYRSLCAVDFPSGPNPATEPYNPPVSNLVAYNPQSATLANDLFQLTDIAQTAVLSSAVMNGNGIIALEPINGQAGVNGTRALKLNPTCKVNVNICEGGGMTTIFHGAKIRRGLEVLEGGIASFAQTESDFALTVLSKATNPGNPPKTFIVNGVGQTKIQAIGGGLGSEAVLMVNDVTGSQNVNLFDVSSDVGQNAVSLFKIKSTGETTIKRNSANGLALNIKNNSSDVFNFYADGSTEIKVNNPSALANNRVLAIKDLFNNRDLFVIKNDGKVYAREVEITNVASFPDYVFDKNYKLKTISEVQNFILENKHLPGFEKGTYYEENGINVTNLLIKQQEKLEEQMLYIIELEQKIKVLSKLEERIIAIENSNKK